jgi:nucleoside-diphosphate-sugar epimerase
VRVLLTVARALLRQGCEVFALIRPGSNQRRIVEILPQLQVVSADLTAMGESDEYLKRIRPALCIHLAWFTAAGQHFHSQQNLDLLTQSVRLAQGLAAVGCKRLVVAGTYAEYDLSFGYLRETTPARPGNLYAATKLALLLVLEQLSQVAGFELAWLRLFNIYGPWESEGRIVSSVMASLNKSEMALVSPGEQMRDFLHVDDGADAIVAAALSDVSGVVNVGSGQPAAIGDVARMIGDAFARPDLVAIGAVPYRANEQMFVCADIGKLRHHTQWQPRYDLKSGLVHTVEWWKSGVCTPV